MATLGELSTLCGEGFIQSGVYGANRARKKGEGLL